MKAVNDILQDVALATQSRLAQSAEFLEEFSKYPYASNVLKANDGKFPIYFYPTTVSEIQRQFALLTSKTGSQFKYKFPCILLVLDIPVEFGEEHPVALLDISIATQSNSEWPSYERDFKVFKPILRPIYKEFINQLSKSAYINRPTKGFKYTYIERFNTDMDMMKEAVKIYGSTVDAIELIHLELNLKNLDC